MLIARATAAAARGDTTDEVLKLGSACCQLEPIASRITIAREWLISRDDVCPLDVANRLGNGIAASESCVSALYLALRFRDANFIEMQQLVARMGGDADTIGAMSGAIWGAAKGVPVVPAKRLEELEQRERLLAMGETLHQRAFDSDLQESRLTARRPKELEAKFYWRAVTPIQLA